MSESEEEYEYESGDEPEDLEEDGSAQDGMAAAEGFQSGDMRSTSSSLASPSPGKKFLSTICKDGEVRLLDMADVVTLMQAKVAQITDLLDIPPAKGAALLRHMGWSQEKLTDAYWSNADKLEKAVGVDTWHSSEALSVVGTGSAAEAVPAASSSTTTTSSSSSSSSSSSLSPLGPATSSSSGAAFEAWSSPANPQAAGGGGGPGPGRAPLLALGLPPGHTGIALPRAQAPVTCRICFVDVGPDEALASPCGHFFCSLCYREYLATKLEEGPAVVFTTCPEHKCTSLVPPELWAEAFAHQEQGVRMGNKLSKMTLDQFVGYNKRMRWCPAPNCCKIVMAGAGVTNVRCHPGGCNHAFCFKCGEEAHQPTACEELMSWTEKCQNESETANWILANTKRCPKCNTRIEKNQGCNHMTCSQCKYEFCWMCMGPWTEHGANTGGYYKCNRYDPSSAPADDEIGRAKRELDRYLHYYKRYQSHHQAQKFAEKQLESTERRMVELQETTGGSSWIDVQYLKTANEMVIECRRTLKYTYSFGYYLTSPKAMEREDGGKHRELFENMQEDLERYTEVLSELTEQPIDRMEKESIINNTRVTESFLRNLLIGCEEGLDQVSSSALMSPSAPAAAQAAAESPP
uniref:RBR-type E3 ubiquitin transferase n=1 Tax=Rhizochromulina marina TaxID=1034831 RepID=A0A7S2SUQ6_9STRA